MAEDHLTLIGPDLEMAKPDPLIDQGQELISLGPLVLGGPQINRQAKLQTVGLGAPREPKLIVFPVPGQREGEIGVPGAEQAGDDLDQVVHGRALLRPG